MFAFHLVSNKLFNILSKANPLNKHKFSSLSVIVIGESEKYTTTILNLKKTDHF
jgi:hypothetical protein